MNRPSRSALLTTGAVLAVLGGLVVTGRWSQGQLGPSVRPPTPSRPPTTTMVAPTGVTQVGLTGPVDDVAVSQDAVWAVTGVRVTRFDDATGRPTAVLTATDVSPPPLVRVTAGPDAVWVAVIGEPLDPKRPGHVPFGSQVGRQLWNEYAIEPVRDGC